jgi:hypothetical protein
MNRSSHSVHEDVSRELDDDIDREIRRQAEPSLERFTTVDEAKCAFAEVGESMSKPKTESESDAAVTKKTISRPSKTSTSMAPASARNESKGF